MGGIEIIIIIAIGMRGPILWLIYTLVRVQPKLLIEDVPAQPVSERLLPMYNLDVVDENQYYSASAVSSP